MLVLTRKAKVLSEFGNGAFGKGDGMRFLSCHLRKATSQRQQKSVGGM